MWQGGQDLPALPYDARHRLEALELAGAACVVPRYPGADWEALLGACETKSAAARSTGPAGGRSTGVK